MENNQKPKTKIISKVESENNTQPKNQRYSMSNVQGQASNGIAAIEKDTT